MKLTFNLSLIAFFAVAITFSGCTKTSLSAVSTGQVSNEVNSGRSTLILQPGLDNGSDAFVFMSTGDSSAANTNYNDIPELPMVAWTNNNYPVTLRSYIKFDSLSTIPLNVKIISAHLFLYGLDKKTSNTTPQGNSIYSGSPYNKKYPVNSCLIERARENWSEDSITWNNQPGGFDDVADTIPSSTSQWDYNVKVDVTNLVTKIVKSQKNYGFLIKLNIEERYRSMLFASSEASDTTKRPKLVVIYKLQ